MLIPRIGKCPLTSTEIEGRYARNGHDGDCRERMLNDTPNRAIGLP